MEKEKYSNLLEIKEKVDFIYQFLKGQDDTEWTNLEKFKILQNEGYIMPGDRPKNLQKNSIDY